MLFNLIFFVKSIHISKWFRNLLSLVESCDGGVGHLMSGSEEGLRNAAELEGLRGFRTNDERLDGGINLKFAGANESPPRTMFTRANFSIASTGTVLSCFVVSLTNFCFDTVFFFGGCINVTVPCDDLVARELAPQAGGAKEPLAHAAVFGMTLERVTRLLSSVTATHKLLTDKPSHEWRTFTTPALD